MTEPGTQALPIKDIETFFQAVHAQLIQGECDSLLYAATRAFVALKRTEDWDYGPESVSIFLKRLSLDQVMSLNNFFELPELTELSRRAHLLEFRNNGRLRERFLTSVASNPSRPHLAAEYSLALEDVGEALYEAFQGEYASIAPARLHGPVAKTRRIQTKAVVSSRTAWAPLETFVDIVSHIHYWPQKISDAEQELFVTLNVNKRNPKKPTNDDSLSELYGQGTARGGFRQRVAEGTIGVGAKVKGRP